MGTKKATSAEQEDSIACSSARKGTTKKKSAKGAAQKTATSQKKSASAKKADLSPVSKNSKKSAEKRKVAPGECVNTKSKKHRKEKEEVETEVTAEAKTEAKEEKSNDASDGGDEDGDGGDGDGGDEEGNVISSHNNARSDEDGGQEHVYIVANELDPLQFSQEEYDAIKASVKEDDELRYYTSRITSGVEQHKITSEGISKPISHMCPVGEFFSDLGKHECAGVFSIPSYQRRYSWRPRQVTDLWNDVLCLVQSKRASILALDRGGEGEGATLPSHFFGSITLLNATFAVEVVPLNQGAHVKLKGYDIIDGQQRITSISILLAVVAQAFLDVVKRADDLYVKYERSKKKKYEADIRCHEKKISDKRSAGVDYLDEAKAMGTTTSNHESCLRQIKQTIDEFKSELLTGTTKLMKHLFAVAKRDSSEKHNPRTTFLNTYEEDRAFFADLIDPFTVLDKGEHVIGAKFKMAAAYTTLHHLVREYYEGDFTRETQESQIYDDKLYENIHEENVKRLEKCKLRLTLLTSAILEQCLLSVCMLPEKHNALVMFEALNTRGLPLHPLDILRSFLMRLSKQLSSSNLSNSTIRYAERTSASGEGRAEHLNEKFEAAAIRFCDKIEQIFGKIQKSLAMNSLGSMHESKRDVYLRNMPTDNGIRKETELLNLHYFLIWILPWLMRERKMMNSNQSGSISIEDKAALTGKELKSEFERVLGIQNLVKEITTSQLNEQMYGETWISLMFTKKIEGIDSKTAKIRGDFVKNDNGCTFFRTLFPDLSLTRDDDDIQPDKRRVELAQLLICRLDYYLETLESFMMVMLPLCQGDGLLKLNYDGIDETNKIPESEELCCREIVRSLQMARSGRIVEIIVGMLALRPVQTYSSPASRAKTYRRVLSTLRSLVLRHELIVERQRYHRSPYIIGNVERQTKYIRVFAQLIPLKHTLRKYELKCAQNTSSDIVKLNNYDRFCWDAGEVGNQYTHRYRYPGDNTWKFSTGEDSIYNLINSVLQSYNEDAKDGVTKQTTSELMWMGITRSHGFYNTNFQDVTDKEKSEQLATRHERFKDALRCLLYAFEAQYYRPIVLKLERPASVRTIQKSDVEVWMKCDDYLVTSPKIHGPFFAASSKLAIFDIELEIDMQKIQASRTEVKERYWESVAKDLKTAEKQVYDKVANAAEIRIWSSSWRTMCTFPLGGEKVYRDSVFALRASEKLTNSTQPQIEHILPHAYYTGELSSDKKHISFKELGQIKKDECFYRKHVDSVGNFALVSSAENNRFETGRVELDYRANPSGDFERKTNLYAISEFAAVRDAKRDATDFWELIRRREKVLSKFFNLVAPRESENSWLPLKRVPLD